MSTTGDIRDLRVAFRDSMVAGLRRELIGPEEPFGGTGETPPEAEVLAESPVQRYCAGILFPARQAIDEVEDSADDSSDSATPATAPENTPEERNDDEGEAEEPRTGCGTPTMRPFGWRTSSSRRRSD